MLYKDYLFDENDSFYLSLSKLAGKPIKDIKGMLSTEWGDATFILSQVVFEDGSTLFCEGEHDMPYVVDYGRDKKVLPSYEDMNSLYKQYYKTEYGIDPEDER